MIDRITFFVSLVLLSSCTVLYFEVPQPDNQSLLTAFPEQFWGRYLSEEGDIVTIEASRFIHPEKLSMVLPASRLDSMPGIKIVGDKLFDDSLPDAGPMSFMIAHDTVYYEATFYQSQWLSDSLVLKQMKKWVVVNTKEEDYWLVYLISVTDDSLDVYSVKNLKPEEADDRYGYEGRISNFTPYTTFKQIDESVYVLDPSKGEFRKLIKKGLFKKTISLKRID